MTTKKYENENENQNEEEEEKLLNCNNSNHFGETKNYFTFISKRTNYDVGT